MIVWYCSVVSKSSFHVFARGTYSSKMNFVSVQLLLLIYCCCCFRVTDVCSDPDCYSTI